MTVCSQCGRVKGEVNRWFVLWDERAGTRLCLIPWAADPDMAKEFGVQTLCGEQCVSKAVSQFMARYSNGQTKA